MNHRTVDREFRDLADDIEAVSIRSICGCRAVVRPTGTTPGSHVSCPWSNPERAGSALNCPSRW